MCGNPAQPHDLQPPPMPKESKSLTFDEFADELLEERQPRALIILASAQIDTQLRQLLEAFLWPKRNKAKDPDELLDGESPLSTFSSRIKIAARLGIIDIPLANTLDGLRGMRNQAAHWISFGVADSPLREQLKHLHSLVVQRRSYRLTVSKFFPGGPSDDMESLQAVLLTLCALLGSIQTTLPSKRLQQIQKAVSLD
jgi:hypothetical protein